MRNTSITWRLSDTNYVMATIGRFTNLIDSKLGMPGRTMAYNDKLGLLFVKATTSELDAVERVIELLNKALCKFTSKPVSSKWPKRMLMPF